MYLQVGANKAKLKQQTLSNQPTQFEVWAEAQTAPPLNRHVGISINQSSPCLESSLASQSAHLESLFRPEQLTAWPPWPLRFQL
jgi:hypothetical protein